MTHWLLFVAAVPAAAVGALATWAVFSRRVRDGVLGKFGLICVAIGALSVAWRLVDGSTVDDEVALENAGLLIGVGLALVLASIWLHMRRGGPPLSLIDLSRNG